MSRLLFLSPRVPHPLNTGAKIRTHALLRALTGAFEVDYAGFLQPELPEEAAREALRACRSVKLVPEPATTRLGKVWLALRTLASPRPATVQKYYDGRLATQVCVWLRENPEGIIHADHVHMAAYLELAPAAGRHFKVMDEHNVEAVIVERLAEQYAKSPAAVFFRLQARRMRATEAKLARRCDLVLAVSEGDAEQLRTMAPQTPVQVIPNGVDLDFFKSVRPETLLGRKAGQLNFTGSMNWFPNEDAVLWFAKEIMPKLGGDYTFDIVGHAPGPAVRALAGDKIRVTGTVDDTRPYTDEAAVFIVPLRIGGGSRLKILEAFAMGIAVISTTVGCEGLGVEHGKQLLVADGAEAFAAAIARVRSETELAERLTAAATAHVRAHFGWGAIGSKLVEIYQGVRRIQ